MTTPERSTAAPGGASDLIRVLDAYLADLQAGQAPDRAALLAAHPELAAQLESCLAALDFIHRAERPDPTMPPTLGDFRIVREIGRGAWGVVYEAEQISLKRRVALKVLRFGGPADPAAMARFQREAETVAQLHHTNIMPIFAVGCEGGVHYFAMQLIAGRSLAAVLKEAQDNKQALDARAVCGWGVQAAEALAHAHARGVVHRDVKPSNLLLDDKGIVWLADFGLARRHDETAMTLAGAAVGTPRYMSPEQASAVAKPVDQRSDVYSLGATLYELVTGRPVFEAATVTELYRQIAESEPVSPRRVREELPRDLETVLLKCLAKEPRQRYATAQELADDLRRVVSGDPVRARRPNVLLRLRRWAGQHRRQVRLAAAAAVVAVVATLVLSVAGQYWWSADREARKGSVRLQYEDGLARGEIVDMDGKPAVPPFTLPTESPIELPGGMYRLRVTQPGRLSEDYELFVEQGQQRTFTVGCNDRQLWEPTTMPEYLWETKKLSGMVPVDGGALHISCEMFPEERKPPGEIRINPVDAVTIKRLGNDPDKPFVPQTLWTLRLTAQDPALAPLGPDAWHGLSHGLVSLVPVERDLREHRPTGKLIQPAPDLDGDGVGDLVFVCGPFVLAVSGKDGKVLWCRRLHSKALPTKTATWWLLTETEQQALVALSLAQAIPGMVVPVPPWMNAESRTQLAGPPLVVADIDGDGHPDLIFAHGAYLVGNPIDIWWEEHPWQGIVRPCVEAVSGRTGKTLWRHELPLAERLVVFRKCPYREEILKGDYRHTGEPRPIGEFAALTERQTDQGRTLLAGLYNEIERLDLRTGRPLAPPTPLLAEATGERQSRWGGYPENWTKNPECRSVAAWSADGKMAFVRPVFPERGYIFRGVTAIDTRSGEELYSVAQQSASVLADLDGDGVPDIITTTEASDGTGTLEVFDGATGKLRWKSGFSEQYRRTTAGKDMIMFYPVQEAALPGPDFDGDGYRDVFTAKVVDGDRFGHPRDVKVLLAALRSGKDGRPLWLTAEPIPLAGMPWLEFREGGTLSWANGKTEQQRPDFGRAVFYWQSAPGIAGHFVVNVTAGDQALAFFFAADTGRLAHVWPGLTVDGIADLDGDGLLDLYGRNGKQRVTVRGIPPEVWRRPGIWSWRYPPWDKFDKREAKWPIYLTGPVPHADLYGEGVADILYFSRDDSQDIKTLRACSGRDGRLLWERSANDIPNLHYASWVECLDLEGGKRPVVNLWRSGYDEKQKGTQCAVLDGRNGKLRWLKTFPGKERPDLLYRQPDGRLVLVYQQEGGDRLVAVNADGIEVHRATLAAKEGKEAGPLPAGFESRFPWEAPTEKRRWRFGQEWEDYRRHDGRWIKMPYPVAWGVDPADSALLRFYIVEDGRLTVLRKGIPTDPATEVPTCSYPDEPVFKRPLPWLERTRAEAKVGVGCVVAYLVLAAFLAALGRRKMALFLLALFILLPAFGAAVGLVLVLAVLVAALPRQDRWWKTALRAGLILVPVVLLAGWSLWEVDPSRALTSTVWTYPVVLVPLIVLALAGWRKTALGLLVPCLLLLLYLNWPSDDYFKVLPVDARGRSQENREPNWYLLKFELLVPPYEGAEWQGPGVHARSLVTLYPHEAWDWTGWYWLWPNQLASWSGPLAWVLVLVGGAEFVRWLRRKWKAEMELTGSKLRVTSH